MRMLAMWLVACAGSGDSRTTKDDSGAVEGDTDTDTDADTDADTDTDTDTDCELGLACNPIPVTSFPYTDTRDTTAAPGSNVDSYSCAPSTDESGPEWFYAVTVPAAGVLGASLTDDEADIDLHLLDTVDADSCLTRGHTEVGWYVDAGTYILVADTWVNGDGTPLAGEYTLTVQFTPTDGTKCALERYDQRMFWSGCVDGIDCYEDGGEHYLRTPAYGPVVKEAHLVTVDDGFGDSWPTSFWDGIPEHYAMSQAATGADLERDQPWAPAGEGGSEYGQGATGAKIPVLAEAWYVNMYWKDRPEKGARMLVLHPQTGEAVVTAAGYETGPGSNEAIGGAVEEVHLALGTGHRDPLIMGFLKDQTLDYGPITCE